MHRKSAPMIRLVSPDYNLDDFCKEMQGKNPVEVIEAASAEMGYSRRLYREATQEHDFPKGSKGAEYCDKLQKLISMLMNGSVPPNSSHEFLLEVKPLVQQLLQKWEIGDLRHVFSDLQQHEGISLPKGIDPLVVVISRDEVDAMDTTRVLATLKKLIATPETAREFVERIEISFHGYDNHPEELFEITEVRNFVYELDEKFPYWLFFLSKQYLGLQCILLCFLPPFLTEEGRERVYPERIRQLLTNRWFPAMNQICEYVGLSETKIEQLSLRALTYIRSGRFRIISNI